MAGGGGGLGGGPKPKRGGSLRKAKKRVGFHLDMTPLVDITFLLLTFFMLTTSMITPQTMDLAIPPDNGEVDVAMSKLLTIRVREDGKIFYNMGKDIPNAITLKDLRKIIVDQNVALNNQCIVVLKPAANLQYKNMIEVFDVIEQAEPEIIEGLRRKGTNERKRKFSVSPLDGKELEEIKVL